MSTGLFGIDYYERSVLDCIFYHFGRSELDETMRYLHMLTKHSPDLMNDPEIVRVTRWADESRKAREEYIHRMIAAEFE